MLRVCYMTVQLAQRGPEAARIDTRPDTAKIGSDARVDVQRDRFRAIFGVEKRFHTAWTRFGHGGPRKSFMDIESRAQAIVRARDAGMGHKPAGHPD